MPHTLRRTLILIGLLAVAILVIATCSREEPVPTPEPTPPPTAAPATSAPEAPTATPADTPTSPPATEAQTAAPAEQAVVTGTAAVSVTGEVTATQPTTPTGEAQEGGAGCTIPPAADFSGYGELEQRMGCALADASFEPVGIHEFGEGPDYDRFMLWFGEEEQIYVLFPDKSWLAYSDTWQDGEPEIFCNPTDGPAASPPLPRRGFGKLWCTVESVQQQLGLSDREERLCQHAVTQRFEQGRLLACFEDATIRYFRLLNDGAWDMELVQ